MTPSDIKPETPDTEPNTLSQDAGHEPSHDHDHDHDHGHHHHGPELNEACKREVTIEIPAADVEKATEKVIRKFQKQAHIKGFRAGKVPASIIKGRFMDDVRQEVVESLVPDAFRAEVQRSQLVPVSQPRISDLHFHQGEPLRFKATFEVLPPIEVTGYKDLSIEKKDITVTDEEVQEALKSLQDRQASYEAIDDEAHAVQDGEFAQISFVGTAKGTKKIAAKKAELTAKRAEQPEGEPADPAVQAAIDNAVEDEINKPVEVNDVLVEIGGKNTVKEFSENLKGLKAGDEREFDVTYPDDFSDQRLAGQVMHYQVKVLGAKRKSVPELNDEFAKELGEFTTIDEVRAKVRENMEAERKHEVEHAAKEKLIDELVARNSFEVPQSLIERQIDVRLDRGFRALAAQGMKPEDFRSMNLDRLREAQKESALREVKASLLLDRIAELENLDASEADLDRELEIAALQTKQPVEALRKRLTDDGSLDRIRDRIRNEKALDFLYSQSA